MSNNLVWMHAIFANMIDQKSKSCIFGFTGLIGNGKSIITNIVEQKLHKFKRYNHLLDGNGIRMGLDKGLDFFNKNITENIRCTGEVSKLFVDVGLIVIATFKFHLKKIEIWLEIKKD